MKVRKNQRLNGLYSKLFLSRGVDHLEIKFACRNLQQQIYQLQESIEQQNAPQSTLVRCLSELKESLNEKRREKRTILKDIAFKTGNCNILEKEISQITDK